MSAVVFIGINKLFDLTEKRFSWFNAIVGAALSAAVFLILWGNRLLELPVLVTLIGIAIATGVGYLLGSVEDPGRRMVIGLAGGGAIGLLLGLTVKTDYAPSLEPVSIVIGVAVGAALGYGWWALSRNGRETMVQRVLAGTAVGWLFGGWLAADFDGSRVELVIVALVLGLTLGGALGRWQHPDPIRRGDVAVASRKYIFLAPALIFVGATLVIPLIRTIWLGFLTGSPRDLRWNGLTNYADIFSDPNIIDFDDASGLFTSRLFWVGLLLIGGGLIAGRVLGRQIGANFSAGAGSVSMLAGGVTLLGFAVFTVIRGTISNNIWWIFAVIIFAVGLGLAVAVLADRAKGENIAKSLIFLPMAISFVGAGIIWRLIYVARPPQEAQSGVLNTLWVQIGKWSNSTSATTVISVILGVIAAALLYLAWRGWQAESSAILTGSLVSAAGIGWLIYRFVGPGLGGFKTDEVTGQIVGDPVLFIQENPFNNFWMMVVFIWIQTGFAMVIFSAAIKAVPEDLLEASRIDGATEAQTFWRVTVPQIYPTIGVVVTTFIVTVLRVFDIPKVMTNGNFDTQVLANEMWERAFTQLDFGLGSAVAVVLFVAVLPVMFINIRRMQRERLG